MAIGDYDPFYALDDTDRRIRILEHENGMMRAQLDQLKEQLLRMEGRYLALMEEHAYLKLAQGQTLQWKLEQTLKGAS